MAEILFNNLKRIHDRHQEALKAAVSRVMDRAYYILGPEGESFEKAFSEYQEGGFTLGVANGTDALEVGLRALGIGPGDEVITVSHTAIPTVYAIERLGAKVIFVDIDPRTYTMDPAHFEQAITERTRAVVPVHLYGHPADMPSILQIASSHGIRVVEDCAQAHGARIGSRKVGTFGDIAAFSFYPTKNLGCYGDGGAVFTQDEHLAARIRRLRNYGQERRYLSEEFGVNSRLDEIQAAILSVKLPYLDEHNQERRRLAQRYQALLTGLQTPTEKEGFFHVFHLYVVKHPERDRLMKELAERGIGTLIHYPVPIHLQKMYLARGHQEGELPVTERSAREIFSLPIYVGLSEEEVERVAAELKSILK